LFQYILQYGKDMSRLSQFLSHQNLQHSRWMFKPENSWEICDGSPRSGTLENFIETGWIFVPMFEIYTKIVFGSITWRIRFP
jgi:hypothetical protein